MKAHLVLKKNPDGSRRRLRHLINTLLGLKKTGLLSLGLQLLLLKHTFTLHWEEEYKLTMSQAL
jgi:hypothetical protein